MNKRWKMIDSDAAYLPRRYHADRIQEVDDEPITQSECDAKFCGILNALAIVEPYYSSDGVRGTGPGSWTGLICFDHYCGVGQVEWLIYGDTMEEVMTRVETELRRFADHINDVVSFALED